MDVPPAPAEPPLPAEAHFEVGRGHKGLSLFDFLDAVAGPVDRKALVSAAHHGEVRVNGEPVPAGTTLAIGDTVTLAVPLEGIARASAGDPTWLYSGAQVVVADKPSGLAYDAGRRGGPSALGWICEQFPREVRPRPVHRLDKQTSGVVVAALGQDAEARLIAALDADRARVEYLAVVRRPPKADEGVESSPLGRRERRASVGLFHDEPHGRPCETAWRVQERWRGFGLLRLVPLGRGRSHQVRGHLAALGHAALCDSLYGEDDRLMLSQLKLDYRPKRGRPERPMLSRPAIHAERLVLEPEVAADLVPDLDAPASGAARAVIAPLPHDLDVLFAQLRRLFPLS